MARKLKTFVTSIGFYDLAVAAPSMKAAAEAWGSRQDLFQQGLARATDDPAVIAAAMAKPGVVLRRAVGTNRPYLEQAPLPDTLLTRTAKREPARKKTAAPKRKARSDPKAQQAAILSFEQAKAKRDNTRKQEEAAEAKERAALEREAARRARAVAKASAVLDQARARHDYRVKELAAERQALDDQLAAEAERWQGQEKELKRKIHEADK